MPEPTSQVDFDSSAAEREFFEAARVYVIVLRIRTSFRVKDWKELEAFMNGSHGRAFLVAPVKNGTTCSLLRSRLHDILPLETFKRYDSPGLRGGFDEDSILLETPRHCMPYVYLSLSDQVFQRRGGERRGMLLYAAEDHVFDFLDQFWSERHENASKQAKHAGFDILVHKLLISYMTSVIGQAKKIDANIRLVEAALETRDSTSLSDLLHQLNISSNMANASTFDQQALFSKKAFDWIIASMDRSNHIPQAQQLQEVSESMEVWQPSRMKERISELRVHVDHIKIELRQKREEDRQKREDARQEREEKRAVNEAKLLAQSIRIAEETQRDSRTMRGIAWVTIAFLPATFVSSFFGMNFFNGIAGNVPFDEASRNVWLFFVVAVPVSAIVLFTFYFWDKHEQMNDNLRLKGSKDGNELRLMQAEMDYLMEENGSRYTL
ncbi:hypothetical protein CUC08_Gglean002471 [Alternaria sp. MG1]|jgi:hypothetical protein|uniref:Uncharacterized protein n=1 Tax=Alternaria tenuissima TaxID=119927 RepID=A0AB37W7C9_9PLEO|nr:hypothetical protein CUC08_Gglean002471 [Alternaria sp. MG1]RYN18819.1 hypothetical protein AA0115_g11146 [Alternaria tenuissima]RYN95513.1 hypothetical protein AA0119_g8614 [Alternaria tenuissima]RYO09870.1 hypothetical protein AA0121_g10840 [Alternaria tenuissima]